MSKTAKIFQNGRSQAVRLPAEFRFSTQEVFIERQGDSIVLRPKPENWEDFFSQPSKVPTDYLSDRNDAPPETREMF